jgi:hypothetical protein
MSRKFFGVGRLAAAFSCARLASRASRCVRNGGIRWNAPGHPIQFHTFAELPALTTATRRRRTLLLRAILIPFPDNPQTFQSQKFIHRFNVP